MSYKLSVVKFTESFYVVTLFPIKHFTLREIFAMEILKQYNYLFTHFSFTLHTSSTRFESIKNIHNKSSHKSEDMFGKEDKMEPQMSWNLNGSSSAFLKLIPHF